LDRMRKGRCSNMDMAASFFLQINVNWLGKIKKIFLKYHDCILLKILLNRYPSFKYDILLLRSRKQH
jgi:hypothetical protein